MYENNYKALNLITTALGRNVYERVLHLEMAHEFSLKCAILTRVLLKLSLLVRTLTIGSIKPPLRHLLNLLMIDLLGLSPL
jgi:hypothetical protein